MSADKAERETEANRGSEQRFEFTDEDVEDADESVEPEVVGVHSAIIRDTCTHYVEGDSCGDEATHTLVLYDGTGVVSFAVCDEHGEPDEVADDRRWSGARV